MASQITVSGDDLRLRPVTRPGEILEAAPGLIVTQHSGEGKANQYFLRGYNLDHGTNGAMSTEVCRALLVSYRVAVARPTKLLLLTGGSDYWSNGIDLAAIEAADSGAEESWLNINAIDDLAEAVIGTTDRLGVSVLRGNAGAGGVFLSLAADEVWAARGVVLNPHYKDMGNLFGSEYWTYLLPRRAGTANAARITSCRLPMGVAEAARLGLVNQVLDAEITSDRLINRASALVSDAGYAARLAKKQRRAEDEYEECRQ